MKRLTYTIVIVLSIFLINNRINAYTGYKIGDVITYNGMEFYVIKDSGSKETSVTMLKKEPLTVEEVNRYGLKGTDNNHINKNSYSSIGEAYDRNGYGGMAYYSSEKCGHVNNTFSNTECKFDYESSDIKYVVDAWAKDKIQSGLENARLLTEDEVLGLLSNSSETCENCETEFHSNEKNDDWVNNRNYAYWTMSSYYDSKTNFQGIYVIPGYYSAIYLSDNVVRPVITLSKTVLGDKDESVIEEDVKQIILDKKEDIKQTSTKVKVENTYMSQSIIIIILGFIIGCISLTLYYIIRKKEGK